MLPRPRASSSMAEASGTRISSDLGLSRIELGALKANCYILATRGGEAMVVDPGDEVERIESALDASSLHPTTIVATHAHPDHISAAAQLVARYGAPFCLHPADSPLLPRLNFFRFVAGDGPVQIPTIDIALADGASLSIGESDVSVVHTPGHTPGGICLDLDGALLTGDTIVEGRPGRTDPPWGDAVALDGSIARLCDNFPPETSLYPGHGPTMPLSDLQA
jgi:hydroxyacylglutathione hydrolase